MAGSTVGMSWARTTITIYASHVQHFFVITHVQYSFPPLFSYVCALPIAILHAKLLGLCSNCSNSKVSSYNYDYNTHHHAQSLH